MLTKTTKIARTTPYMITSLGYGMYFVFGGILLGMGVWAFIFVPETKGISLEEMDSLFLQPMHKVVWAQMRGKNKFWRRGDEDGIVADKLEKDIEVAQVERR